MIICSSEKEKKSNIISRLYSYRRKWNIPIDEDMEQLKEFIWQNITEVKKNGYNTCVNASVVDTNW